MVTVRLENSDPLLGRLSAIVVVESISTGDRFIHNGRSGRVVHLDDVSHDSDLVALVAWDPE